MEKSNNGWSFKKIASHLLHGDRWLALIAGMWIMACGGLSFTFAIYSPAVKSVLGYDQTQIQTLAVFKDIGESVGIIAGLTNDIFPSWVILSIGAIHNLVGFGGFWLVLSGYIPPLPFWQMAMLLLIGSQAASYFNTVNLVTNVRNFPKSRGPVVGILKGLVGLSGAIFTQLYSAFMAPDQKGFLFVIALVPLGVVLITTPFIKAFSPEDRKESSEEESSLLSIVIAICFSLAAFLLATMVAQDSFNLSPSANKAMAAVMVAIILLPLTAPILSYFSPEKERVPLLEASAGAYTAIPAVPQPSKVPRKVPTTPLPISRSLSSSNPVRKLLVARNSSFDTSLDAPVSANSPLNSSVNESLNESLNGSLNDFVNNSVSDFVSGTPPLYSSSPNIYQYYSQSGVSKPPLHPSSRGQSHAATSSQPLAIRRSAPVAVPSAHSGGSPSPNFAFSPFGGYASDDILSADDKERQVASSHWPESSPAPSAPPVPAKKPPQPHLIQSIGEGSVGFLSRQRRRRGPRRGENFTLSQAVVKADFWLLFGTFVAGCGTGLAAINNLAQMGAAQGYASAGVFVSIVSVWNFCGRLAAGFLSEMLIKEYCTPRVLVLLMAQLLMTVGHLLLALAFPGSLYIGSLLVGLCYGAHWAIMPATASELFGLKHFGIIYNVLAIANPLGSYLCSDLIAAYFYEREARLGTAGKGARALGSEGECFGAHCFRSTFLVMMGVCLFGACLNLVLVRRTKAVYVSLYRLAPAADLAEEGAVEVERK